MDGNASKQGGRGQGVTIEPDRYYIGMWFVSFNPEHVQGVLLEQGKEVPFHGMDCLFTVSRPLAAPHAWRVDFRTRYHVDDLIWDSQDRKRFERKELPPELQATENELISMVDAMAAYMSARSPGARCFVYRLQTDGAQAADRIVADPPPFMHLRAAPEVRA